MSDRNSRSWSPAPVRSQSLQQLAITSGRNRALVDFYKMMLEHRWDVKADRLDHQQDLQRDWYKNWLAQQNNSTAKSSDSSGSSASPDTGSSSVSSPLNMFQRARSDLMDNALSNTDVQASRDDIVSNSGVGAWTKSLEQNNISVERHAGESDKAYYDRLVKMADALRKEGVKTDHEYTNPERLNAQQTSDSLGAAQGLDFGKGGIVNTALHSMFGATSKALDNEAVGKVYDSEEFAAFGDGLLKVLDVISRPLYATANFTKAWTDDANQVGPHTSKQLSNNEYQGFGENPIYSNPAGVFTSAPWKAAWKGLTGEEKTTFADVMRQNAEQDPTKNIYDNKTYQAVSGLVGDVVLDPLNFVGVGVARAPLKVGRGLKEVSEINKLSKDLEGLRVLKSADGDLLTSEKIYDLLGGSVRKPSTYAERNALYDRVQTNVAEMHRQLADTNIARWSNKKITKYDALKAKLTAERDAVVAANGRDTFIGELRYRLGIEESSGSVPAGSVDNFDRMISDVEIGNAFESERIRNYRTGTSRPVGLKGKKGDPITSEALSRTRYKKDVAWRKANNKDPITYEAWVAEHKSFDEALGPAWTGDYRLTDADRKQIKDDIFNIASREDSGFRALTQRSIAIDKQIKDAQDALDSGNLSAAEAKATKGRKYAAQQSKKIVDARKDQLLGQLFGTYTDHYVRMNRSGEQFFKDTQEAQRLLGMRRQIESELSSDASNVSYTGVSEVAPSDLTQSLDPISGFMDRHSHLNAALTQVNKKLDSLSASIGDSNSKIVSVPPEYMKDGVIDEQAIKQGLTFDEAGQIASRDSNDVFLGDVARYLNDRTEFHTKRLLDQASRPINEEVATSTNWSRVEAAATKGDANAKHVLDMFDRYGSREGLFPFVKIGDQKVFLATGPKFEEAMAKHVSAMDKAKAVKVKSLIEGFNKDTKLSKYQAKLVKDLLMADGKLVPAYRGGLREYLLHHGGLRGYALKDYSEVKNLFTPERIAFERMFVGEHNLSLAEAMNMRDRAMGKLIKRGGSWGRKHPDGVTLQEYFDKVTASKESLRETIIGGPFSLDTPKFGGWAKYRDANKSKRAVKDLENEWVNATWKALIDPGTDTSALISRSWKATYKHENAARTLAERGPKNVARSEARLDPQQVEKIKYDARNAAWDEASTRLKSEKLKVSQYDTSFRFRGPLNSQMSEDDLFEALKIRIGEDTAEEIRKARLEARTLDDAKASALDARIKEIHEKKANEIAKLQKAKKEAVESRKVMINRLHEDAVMRALTAELGGETKSLTLNSFGASVKIPGSHTLFEAMDEFSGLPLIKQTRELWAKAFTASSSLPFEMQLTRQRMLGNTPNIIAMHVRDLRHSLGNFSSNERAAALRGLMTGGPVGNPEAARIVQEKFDELLPYFNLKVKDPSGRPLTVNDIMKYAPDEYTLIGEASNRSYDNIRDLMNAFEDSYRVRNQALKRKGQPRIKKDADAFEDPLKVLWNMRIATEQALARRALIHTVNEGFGIPRGMLVGGKYMIGEKEVSKGTHDIVESLHTKGWKTVEELGNTHYFPPESHEDIAKLIKMTEPKEISRVGKTIDYATRIWKTSVTIYNPGYYTRNAVGEVMASWFAGLNNPKYYRLARQWVKYARNEGSELAALKSHFPMLEYTPSGSAMANHVAVTTKSGRKISYEQLNVMYHDQALKTGFIRTEFNTHFSKTGEALREHGANVVSQAHNKLRDFGEWYEDYFRMAHFMHEVEHAPKGMSLEQIAQHAASQVRKYHFDYSDFTNFEKTIMLRAFPFYKWTRKALPLMTTMLFQKPGKVLAYPKVMHAANEATINTQDMEDSNSGFMPVYAGIVPAWMQDMWTYKIAEDESAKGLDDSTGTYFNMATPQMDIYKQTADPIGSGYQLLNPFLKVLLEQGSGKTNLTSGAPGTVPGMSYDMETSGDRATQLMRNAGPWGSFFAKLAPTGKGQDGIQSWSKEELASFITGLGFYENNKDRQIGELGRRDGLGK